MSLWEMIGIMDMYIKILCSLDSPGKHKNINSILDPQVRSPSSNQQPNESKRINKMSTTTTTTTSDLSTTETHQSSCLCGKNVISYTGPPTLKFKCHCLDERK